MFDKILPYLLAGISVGGQYALIAVGYTMVYGILRLINFAHGDIFTAAGFFMVYFAAAMPLYLAIPLVVVVTDVGIVRDTVVRVSEELDADALYAISRTLTEQLRGATLQEAFQRMPLLTERMQANQALLSSLGNFLQETDAVGSAHVAVGGTSNMLAYPEYSDLEKARSFLSLMETRDKLAQIISQHGDVAFTVRIGPETGVPEMADCSIVTATYATRAGQQGTIGVIGPTRMQYRRVLSVLSNMGRQLSELLGDEQEKSPE